MRAARGLRRGLIPALLLVAILTACGGNAVAPGEPDHVRAVVLPYLALSAFHVAAEEGYFAERDLDVEFVRLGRIQEMLTSLTRGEVDVAAGFLSVTTLNAIAGNAPVRAVGALGYFDPDACAYNAFVARRELVESGAIRDPERVRGLRADLDVTIPIAYWFDVWLEPMGLTLDDLDVVNLPSPAGVEALRTGVIDITHEAEPYLSVLEESPEVDAWLPTKDLLPGYPYSVLLYGGRLLDERPDVGERFAAAMLEALRQLRQGKTERNVELLREFTGLSRDQVEAACWPVAPPGGRLDGETLRGFQEWALARGLADRVLANEEFIDPRFFEAASAR
ncbi:MAG: ABC transporter substrate-binding protein [Acidobacteriota bacterium]|jgi:NitT/TauT family transport system substrate-binding protein